jgi:transcriptional regulator with XRE-family HTH domain
MRHPDAKKIRFAQLVGSTLRAKRQEAGISVRVAAAHTGQSPGTLTKVEDGQQTCTLFALAALAELYDCSLDELCPVMVDEAAE